jgi:teichoic acid transport system permease protein
MVKKKLILGLCCIILLLNSLIFIIGNENVNKNIELNFMIKSDQEVTYQIFYSSNENIVEENSVKIKYNNIKNYEKINCSVPADSRYIRIDFGDISSKHSLSDIFVEYKNNKMKIDNNIILNAEVKNMITKVNVVDNEIIIETEGNDAFFLINMSNLHIGDYVEKVSKKALLVEKIIICAILDTFFLVFIINSKKLLIIPLELYRNRKLILNLAKNDFKTKYAGSYFGIIWAFVQPVVTILLYWFVFQVGFRSTSVEDFPFVLWLIAGLIPWFFYSDGITFATNCLIEYSYLVKKVVFRISVLPMVKIISALFIHLFFVCFMLFIYSCYGYFPTPYTIQLLYYTFCIFTLVLAITYSTSAIVLFFKDLGQIITILLQVGMWMSPIMWNINIVPEKIQWLFKLNPMYYIIEGYRDSLINHVWFYDKLLMTTYFWVSTGILLIVGTLIFRRLKPHFADVL